MSIRRFIRRFFRGASWQNPVANVALHVVNPIDRIVCRMRGRKRLPPFSTRVRSAGIKLDIGGKQFVEEGLLVVRLLRAHAQLRPDSRVLEIGCGCGRTAIALAGYLKDGNYSGMDIEPVALDGARANPLLRAKGFEFRRLDIRNSLYNPGGRYAPTEYELPYPGCSFDVVFLMSVFTHMLTDEVRNYITEIARVLKPGGRCFLTSFLLDRAMVREFPFRSQEHNFADKTIPEIAVAYNSSFLTSTFAQNGMACSSGPLWGTVHGALAETTEYQDLIVFKKRE